MAQLPLYRSAIGLDRMANLFDSLAESAQSQQPNWPPYNIEKKARPITGSLWRLPVFRSGSGYHLA